MGAFLERARVLFRQVRYDLAEGELLRELAANPHNPLALALLGLCRGRLQRFDEAVLSCRAAVRLAPECAYTHYALAYILDDCNHLDEASAAVAAALRLNPGEADYHALLAYIRSRQRSFEESLAAAEEGLRLAPTHVHCLNRRAMALAHMLRPEEAEQVIRSALAQDPQNAVTLANFGWVLLEQQKPAPALEHLQEALRLDPRLSWARQKTVDALVLLVEQGLQSQALKHFPDALRRDPEMEVARQRLVQALIQRMPEPLARGLQTSWLLGCYLTLGSNPQPRLVVLLLILLILYVCILPRRFVLVDPLYYLVLRLRRLGRQVLSAEQVRGGTRVGLCLAATLVTGLVALLIGSELLLVLAVVFQSLVLPVAYLTACPPGRSRSGMGAFLGLLLVGGVSLVGLGLAGLLTGEQLTEGRDLVFLLGAGITGLLARALLWWNNEK